MRILHNNYRKGIFLAICTSLFMLPACSKGKGGSGGGAQDGDEEYQLNPTLALFPSSANRAEVSIRQESGGTVMTFSFDVERISSDGDSDWTATLSGGKLFMQDLLDETELTDLRGILKQVNDMNKDTITLIMEDCHGDANATLKIDNMTIKFTSIDDAGGLRKGFVSWKSQYSTAEIQDPKGLTVNYASIEVRFQR